MTKLQAGFANMEFLGFREMERALKSLEDKEQRTAIRRALTRSAQPMVKEARNLAPKETGLLKKSLGSVSRWYQRGGAASDGTAWVGVGVRKGFEAEGRNPRKYLHLVIEGAQPHMIRGNMTLPNGHRVKVEHPGARPNDFLATAFNKKRSEANDRFFQMVFDQVEKAIKRRSRK